MKSFVMGDDDLQKAPFAKRKEKQHDDDKFWWITGLFFTAMMMKYRQNTQINEMI